MELLNQDELTPLLNPRVLHMLEVLSEKNCENEKYNGIFI